LNPGSPEYEAGVLTTWPHVRFYSRKGVESQMALNEIHEVVIRQSGVEVFYSVDLLVNCSSRMTGKSKVVATQSYINIIT
jgi:hypothetical protein